MKGTGCTVKNGICFVYIGVSVVTPSNSWVEVLESLPKPSEACEFVLQSRQNSSGTNSIVIYKDSGTVLNLAFGTGSSSYYGTISYPVA